MTKYKKRKKRLKTGPLLVVSAAAVAVVFFVLSSLKSSAAGSFTSGLSYLQQQETMETSSVQSRINELKQKQLGESIKNGETTIFSAFGDSVIFGDSRVVGFDVYGFLPSTQVFAAAGNTIRNIDTYVDQVAAMQPSYMYFSYGVNDMGLKIGSELGKDGYGQVYEEQINKLLEVSPNSKIIINSIIECTPATVKSEPNWGETTNYNNQIKAICEKNGWTYVNNTPISKGGKGDFYANDGVHFDSTFYPVWAENMIRTALPQILGGVEDLQIPNSYSDASKGSTRLGGKGSEDKDEQAKTDSETETDSQPETDSEADSESETDSESEADPAEDSESMSDPVDLQGNSLSSPEASYDWSGETAVENGDETEFSYGF